MKQRIAYQTASPAAYRAMAALNRYANECGFDPLLLELIKTRASQLNGCAYCIDMHTKDARALGETEQRLYALSAWRETPFFSERECAALEWTEVTTLIAQHEVSDEIYERVRQQFSEKELVDLTVVIISINGWNRLAIPFRAEVGSYQAKK